MSVHYQGIVPDLFREGQGVVAEGKLDAGGSFAPIQCSPNTTNAICRVRLWTRLKKSGRWQEGEAKRFRGAVEMIPELGHYALVLALALGHGPIDRANRGRTHARCCADARSPVPPR